MLILLFFEFKLYLICNGVEKIFNRMGTLENIENCKSLEYKAFMNFTYGKLFDDKEYIGKRLFWK